MKQNEVLQNLKLNSEFDALLTSDNESLMSWLNSYAKTAGVMSEKQKSQAIANLKDKLTQQLEADKRLKAMDGSNRKAAQDSA
jgi:hypothetical protein